MLVNQSHQIYLLLALLGVGLPHGAEAYTALRGLPRLLPVLAICCLPSPPPCSLCLGHRMFRLDLFLTVMHFAYLKVSVSVSLALVVAELSPAAHHWFLCAHLPY